MMKKIVLTSLTVITAIVSFAQSSGPNNPAAAVCSPSSLCLACPGSIWNTPTNVYLQDNNTATVGLMQSGQCFQSTCYYSRFLYASNFGFAIPGTATIVGIVAEIYHQSGNANSAADSSVRLVQNSLPAGLNRALPNPWPTVGAYATYGSASDMWGLAWIPTDINAANFGLYLRVFNASSSATTPSVDHIRITVYYNTSTGFFSQTSSPSTLNAYQNENELNVAFISNEQITKGSLKVFNMLGELQMQKELSNVPAGMNTEKFTLENSAPGIYFVQFNNGTSIQTKKIFIKN